MRLKTRKKFVFSITKMSDAKTVLQALEMAGKTLTTAESCTGGWVGKLLTDVPGSSKTYMGGVISYTNVVKHTLLGVPMEILDSFGAVSEQTAIAMADGVRRLLGSDFGASVTGLAGPDGDGSDRPVGLVYIAVSSENRTLYRRLQLEGGRIQVRESACNELFLLILSMLGIG